MADRDFPGSRLESKVEHDLRCYAVNGAVEKPSFDGEGEDGQCEVRGAFEESMSDQAIAAAFPFCKERQSYEMVMGPSMLHGHTIETEECQTAESYAQWCCHMCIGPSICSAAPI